MDDILQVITLLFGQHTPPLHFVFVSFLPEVALHAAPLLVSLSSIVEHALRLVEPIHLPAPCRQPDVWQAGSYPRMTATLSECCSMGKKCISIAFLQNVASNHGTNGNAQEMCLCRGIPLHWLMMLMVHAVVPN